MGRDQRYLEVTLRVDAEDSQSQVGVLREGTFDTCGGERNVPPISAKTGTALRFAAESYDPDVRSKYQAAYTAAYGAGGSYAINLRIPLCLVLKGHSLGIASNANHNEIPYTWSQEVSVSKATLTVTYSNRRTVDVRVLGVTYQAPYATAYISRSTACPWFDPNPDPDPNSNTRLQLRHLCPLAKRRTAPLPQGKREMARQNPRPTENWLLALCHNPQKRAR